MTTRTRRAVSLALLALAIVARANAQQLKQQDSRPLERTQPLGSIKASDVRSTLVWLSDVLKQEGFGPTETLWDSGELRATRSREGGEDRVVVWLEGSLQDPGKQLTIYLFGGRFEKFVGAPELRRLQLNSTEEKDIFGKLRDAVVLEVLKRG